MTLEKDMDLRVKLLNRKSANEELVSILTDLISLNGDMRFGQILDTMFIENYDKLFYEEPVDTLIYVKEQLKKIKDNYDY